jgi:UDP:flavonoid glycosyltransferase YjiC (YdhE family)
MMAAYNAALQMYKMPETAVDTYAHSPLLGDAFLLRSVPELEKDVTALPSRVHCVGDCLWEPPAQTNAALASWLAEAKASQQPLLYVQPGRVHNGISFWGNLITALKDKPIRVAASVGRIGGEIGIVPANFFVDQHVPQSAILPHASGVICSSTTTAALGAITHGLPLLLVITGDGEQPHIHHRCQQAGVSLNLDLFDASPQNLEQKVNQLLNKPHLQQNAQKLQQSFAQMQQRQRAAHIIEQLAPTQQVIRQTYSRLSLGV